MRAATAKSRRSGQISSSRGSNLPSCPGPLNDRSRGYESPSGLLAARLNLNEARHMKTKRIPQKLENKKQIQRRLNEIRRTLREEAPALSFLAGRDWQPFYKAAKAVIDTKCGARR